MQIVIECENGYQIEVQVRQHLAHAPKHTQAADLPTKDVKALAKYIKKTVEDND